MADWAYQAEDLENDEQRFYDAYNNNRAYNDNNNEDEFRKIMPIYSPIFFGENKKLIGDQIILSASVLDKLSKGDFQFPLFFTLTNLETQTVLSCRAYEFTAPPGVVICSEWLMEELFVENGSQVIIESCTVPKATYIKLKPIDSDYLRWSNQKAVLESTIKAYGTVTLGSRIKIDFGGSDNIFAVIELEPAPHANLIDTDVVVDFEEEIKPFDFSVATETKKESTEDDNKPKRPKRTRRKRGEEPEPEEIKEEKPSTFTGQGFSVGGSTTKLTETKNETPESNTSDNTTNSLLVNNDTDDSNPPPDSTKCENCRKYISNRAYSMHEAFCLRNNYCCPICNQVMPKSKEEEHQEVHKDVPCPDCNQEMQPNLIASHLQKECPKRKVVCNFCALKFTFDELYDHAVICGSRTELCDKCNKYIKLSELEYHTINNCSSLPEETFGVPSSSDNEELFVCPYCFAPFVDFNELNVHMISQYDILLQAVKDGSKDIQSPVQHIGEIKEPEELIKLFESASDNPHCIEQVIILGLFKPNMIIDATNERQLIHHLAEFNKGKALQVLGKVVSDINVEDKEKNTPLHIASENCCCEAMESLLLLDADIYKENNKSLTPIQCIFENTILSNVQKSRAFGVFLANVDSLQFNYTNKHWNIIKGAASLMLKDYYTNSNRSDIYIKRMIDFINSSKGRLKKVQQSFMNSIQKTYKDHVTCLVNQGDNTSIITDDETIEFSVLNNGNMPMSLEFIFPKLNGIDFVVDSYPDSISKNEEIKIIINYEEDEDSSIDMEDIKTFIILKAKNDEKEYLTIINVISEE